MRAPEISFVRACDLRRDMSLPEVLLWDCLRGGRLEGLRFRRQHPIGVYVLDFYCPIAQLAVEVDGAHHDHLGQIRHDARRDAWLAGQGVRVMRIAASDILDDYALEGVLRVISDVANGACIPDVYASALLYGAPPPPPSAVPLPRERGRISAAAGRDLGSSPAKRGRGTMRSMVEGAHSSSTGDELGAANATSGGGDKS